MMAVSGNGKKGNKKKKGGKNVYGPPKTKSLVYGNELSTPDTSRCYPPSQVFRCTRSRSTLNFFTSSITVPTYSSVAFSLSDLPGYAEFVGLFDEYRITKVEIWMIPRATESTTNVGFGMVASCVDYQDNATVASYNELLEHENVVQSQGTQGIYHSWTPNVAVAAYSGAFTSYSSVPSAWIDVNSPSVYHYGYKMAAAVSPTVQIFDASYKYWLEFRHTS